MRNNIENKTESCTASTASCAVLIGTVIGTDQWANNQCSNDYDDYDLKGRNVCGLDYANKRDGYKKKGCCCDTDYCNDEAFTTKCNDGIAIPSSSAIHRASFVAFVPMVATILKLFY